MELRGLLIGFLIYALYPIWLAAGAADYLCHRRTRIAETSGVVESWLHVAQLALIAAILFMATWMEIGAGVLLAMGSAAILHTALSAVDVSYTEKRRYISPFEQHVHGFLDVLPLVAVALLGILYWPDVLDAGPDFRWKQPMLERSQRFLLLGSLLVLGGIPVFEELARTYRVRSTSAADARR
jgi:hypothetical protein